MGNQDSQPSESRKRSLKGFYHTCAQLVILVFVSCHTSRYKILAVKRKKKKSLFIERMDLYLILYIRAKKFHRYTPNLSQTSKILALCQFAILIT
jgi:hypothetical protein